MGFNANDRSGGGGDFTPQEALEPKSYPARLVQLVLMGLQPSRPFKGQAKDPREQLYVTYELSHEFMVDEDGNPDPTKPRWIGENFPFYNLEADRATSTQRYNALDPAGSAGGDWLALIGTACQITVTKEPRKDGKGFTNYVSNVSPAMEVPGYTQPELVNEPRIFDIDEPDMEVFEELPKWLKEKIRTNLNFEGSKLQQLLGGSSATPPPTTAAQASPAPAGPAPTAPAPPPAPAEAPAPATQPVAPAPVEAAAVPEAPAVPTPPPAPPAEAPAAPVAPPVPPAPDATA